MVTDSLVNKCELRRKLGDTVLLLLILGVKTVVASRREASRISPKSS
jgi:hypothetical protein